MRKISCIACLFAPFFTLAIIIASVLTVGAIFGKWLAAFFTQLAFKYSSVQRQLIFGLSTSHAAATLAVRGYVVAVAVAAKLTRAAIVVVPHAAVAGIAAFGSAIAMKQAAILRALANRAVGHDTIADPARTAAVATRIAATAATAAPRSARRRSG